MQISTALSDGVLASASIAAAVLLIRAGRRWCGIWMLAIAAAALVGTIRYAGVEKLETLHGALSLWAALVAFPSFCWALLRRLRGRHDVRAGESLAIAAGLNLFLLVATRPDVPTAVGAVALGIAALGATALFKHRRSLFLMLAWAIAGYAAAGLWVGTTGMLGPMLRIDLYHYLLAAANLLFGYALWRESRPM